MSKIYNIKFDSADGGGNVIKVAFYFDYIVIRSGVQSWDNAFSTTLPIDGKTLATNPFLIFLGGGVSTLYTTLFSRLESNKGLREFSQAPIVVAQICVTGLNKLKLDVQIRISRLGENSMGSSNGRSSAVS